MGLLSRKATRYANVVPPRNDNLFYATSYKIGIRALNTLRYIHANPKAAGMQQGFFYDFSNYGTHDRLSNDGITQWHPASLQLGRTLEECAARYRGFCRKYKPKAKPEKRNHWGSRFLPSMIKRGKAKKSSPGQMSLPWNNQKVTESTEVHEVAEKFIHANCYQPPVPGIGFMKC